jgi:uncharacterized membrane protein
MGGASVSPQLRFLYLAAIVPPLGFWGSGIAKDAIVLFGVSAFCLGVTRLHARLRWIIVGLVLVLLIRPHIGLIMMAGVVVGYLVAPNTRGGERLLILAAAAAATAIIAPLTISYLGLGDLKSASDVSIQINSLAAGYEGTGSYVDLASLPFPLKITSYLFRPFPWEAGSVSQLAAAAQNVLIGFILMMTLPAFFRQRRDWRLLQVSALLGFSLAALVVLAVTTANLGVASRQKWMVLVPLFVILFRAVIADRPNFTQRRAALTPTGTAASRHAPVPGNSVQL